MSKKNLKRFLLYSESFIKQIIVLFLSFFDKKICIMKTKSYTLVIALRRFFNLLFFRLNDRRNGNQPDKIIRGLIELENEGK